MTKFWIPKIDLDEELFKRRNIAQAWYVILNLLARNDPPSRTRILEQVRTNESATTYDRILFETMVEMIQQRGSVDIEDVKQRIIAWASKGGSDEFVEGCLANFEQLLGYRPTSEQVERAIEMVTSPPPERRYYGKKKSEANTDESN